GGALRRRPPRRARCRAAAAGDRGRRPVPPPDARAPTGRAVPAHEHQLRSAAPARGTQQARPPRPTRRTRPRRPRRVAVIFARSDGTRHAGAREELVARFRAPLESEVRASPETVRAYLCNVEQLTAFGREKRGRALGVRDLDIPLLRSYLASLFEEN